MAFCTLRTHLKGHLSINLVLVIILLLDGENFIVHEEDVFMPILGMLLEETLYSCRYVQLSGHDLVSRADFSESAPILF